MIKHLFIENIALIDSLELDLNAGLNVLSGETGAGKSIIIDSLNLILGERAIKELIKTGESKARVEATFDISQHENMQKLLKHNEIEVFDNELIISRELGISGKNVCRVNGSLINLSELKKISGRLVDIHGQHEHQNLIQTKNHINFLDRYGKSTTFRILNEVNDSLKSYNDIIKSINNLCGDEHERQRNLDLLKFEIEEINSAELTENEEDELIDEKKRLFSAEKVIEVFNKSYNTLYDGEGFSVLDKLKETINIFEDISDIDEKYKVIFETLNEAYYSIEEAGIDIRDLHDGFTYNPSDLIEIEKRLSDINNLKRKYGNNYHAIEEYLKKSELEYNRLLNANDELERLTLEKEKLHDKLYDLCMKLSYERKMSAKVFEREMLDNLRDLDMKNAKFEVRFSTIESKEEAEFTKNGLDEVEFYITMNLGQPLMPLSKVASGGEMSRIMLAFKNILGDNDAILTNVFDEIDTGISGKVANGVAEKLGNIAKKRQVICVTHLAQIAAVADQNYLISKQEVDGATITNMKVLNFDEKLIEVSRLAGGVESEISIQYAREMIEKAKN